ncbi:selenophosphate synthase [Pontibacter ummariensis]|uniref:Selenide, water dikinase n=1 Tax=Pontibacter ummariensis TaxID=1610492 RepID=A0A239K944_9BACT|nr:selenide, water dikinase SelD [Pontibacter ummariensis]PRY06035.1 selenophosphate synthase [Pontibacter ummariensis]SNT14192.1 selenophosphate synthase [Pontibacter ummariensis]
MEETSIQDIRLTQYSHGAGCGCKISPKVLDAILHSEVSYPAEKKLLVGNSSRDDAAVYDIGKGRAVISTTDFFMPIVDDAFDFGRIASANAISDVYAMGGTPMMAIAVLGWPINTLAPEVAQRVIEGSRSICHEAGIPLAGGHSIDSPEPIFGLAVTGMLDIPNLKRNDTATAGCELYLTKPLGVGILSTAQKKGLLKAEHAHIAPGQMMRLNKVGEELGALPQVKAMTDVTGFGLLGHLSEMCEGSNLSAEVFFEKVPVIPEALEYLAQKAVPGGTLRNFDSYGHKVAELTDDQKHLLCDPQTSGGLLIAVDPAGRDDVLQVLKKCALQLEPLGVLKERKPTEKLIQVV